MPRFSKSRSGSNMHSTDHNIPPALQMKHKSSFQLAKSKKERQQKQMLHGLVISTVPLSGNEYCEESSVRSNLESRMLQSGTAKLKMPTLAEERDPEMEQARGRDEEDVKEEVEKQHKLSHLFGKMHLPKLKKHNEVHDRALPATLPRPSSDLPSEMKIKQRKYASDGTLSLQSKPLEERVELVAMQQPDGKPFIRILMSKQSGSGNVKQKTPPARSKSMQKRKMKRTSGKAKKKTSSSRKSSRSSSLAASTIPSMISITSSNDGVIVPAAADVEEDRDTLKNDKSLTRKRLSQTAKGAALGVGVAALGVAGATAKGAKGAVGFMKKAVSKKHVKEEDTSTNATPVLVDAGYTPEDEQGQEVVGAKFENDDSVKKERSFSMKNAAMPFKRSPSATAMPFKRSPSNTPSATSSAAASVYATASTKRLMHLKKKKEQQLKKERSKDSSSKKKKSNGSVASTVIVMAAKEEDTAVEEREMPPSVVEDKQRSSVQVLAVPPKIVEEPQDTQSGIHTDDNVSEMGDSDSTGTGSDGGSTSSGDITGATDDIRTVASVKSTHLDKFVDKIFNSFTNQEDEEDDGDDEHTLSDEDDYEEDTVMEMARLKNQRGLIMSPNANRMKVSDDHIMGHSNTWASAFGWSKEAREDDERDLRIMESDSSASSGSYDEEDIPTDYEDFSVDDDDDDEEGSWCDDVEDDDDDSWDVGSMFKLHKNPSDVYDYDDDDSQVLVKKASSSKKISTRIQRAPKNDRQKKSADHSDEEMSKLRGHAQRLGVSERDLVQAMSNPSHPANQKKISNQQSHRGRSLTVAPTF